MAKTKQKIQSVNIIVENKYILWLMFTGFLVSVFVLSTYKIEDDDFYWHLTTGKYIYENKVIPDNDVFSYATQNKAWIPFEWGWDVLIYMIYAFSNINTVSIICSLIFCFIFYLYYKLLKRFNVNSIISILLLFILLVSIFNRLSARPHIFTYLFLTILLFFLLSLKYLEREKYLKRLYFLPVLFLIWGNIHLGVIAGLMLLLAFTITEIIIFYYPFRFSNTEVKPFEKKQLKKLLLIFVTSIAVLFINPQGLETYLYAYTHVKMKMLESIAEWQNPFTGQIEGGIVITLYKMFLFLGSITLIYAYKKKDLFFAIVYIVFAIYSVRAVRFNVDYEIIIVFFIAICINYYLIKIKKGNILIILQSNGAKLVMIIFFIVVITQTFSDNIYLTLKYNRHFGFGINDSFIPYKMIDFMKMNNIRGQTFNNYESGGYFLWNFPGEKNFIDSRNINDEGFNEYMSILSMNPGFENKLEQYGINSIQYFEPKLVKYPNSMRNRIAAFASLSNKWKLIYWDDKSMLFLKDTPENAQIINKFEYKILIPFKAVFSQKDFEASVKNSYERTRTEMNRKIAEEPQGFYFTGMNEIITKVLKK